MLDGFSYLDVVELYGLMLWLFFFELRKLFVFCEDVSMFM